MLDISVTLEVFQEERLMVKEDASCPTFANMLDMFVTLEVFQEERLMVRVLA